MATKTVKLNTGAEMPVIGLGTWKSAPGAVEGAVEEALRCGYKAIDTAAAYQNEAEVGQGIKRSGVARSDIFITTKLPNDHHRKPETALDASLAKLDVGYLDLWLLHWPAPMTDGEEGPDKDWDWLDTWKEMVRLYKTYPDKLKAIGVSNVSVEYLERLLENSEVVPAVNQIELHPACQQKDVVEFCQSKGIILTSYSPLGSDNSPLLKDPIVEQIAKAHSASPANVLISFQANKPNHTVLPKSVTKERIISNLKTLHLSPEEVQQLNSIGDHQLFRACNPEWTGWGHLGFPDRVAAQQSK